MITKTAKEIGYKGYCKYEWCACVDCGKERWVRLYKGNSVSPRCSYCASKLRLANGEHGHSWKGGRLVTSHGYILTYLDPKDPYYPMADGTGHIYEHRLVMAKYLGRCLTPEEVVHHDGTLYPMGSYEDRQDNRIENLILFPNHSEHAKYHSAISKHNKGGSMDKDINTEERTITVKEAADLMNISETTLRRWEKAGLINKPVFKYREKAYSADDIGKILDQILKKLNKRTTEKEIENGTGMVARPDNSVL